MLIYNDFKRSFLRLYLETDVKHYLEIGYRVPVYDDYGEIYQRIGLHKTSSITSTLGLRGYQPKEHSGPLDQARQSFKWDQDAELLLERQMPASSVISLPAPTTIIGRGTT